MGGEIKVVKKNGPGTLMQLYLLLNTPPDSAGKHCQLKFTDHSLMVGKVTSFSQLKFFRPRRSDISSASCVS